MFANNDNGLLKGRMYEDFLDTATSIVRTILLLIWSYVLNSAIAIQNFLAAIFVLALLNTVAGWIADEYGWKFRKALQSGVYIGGYFILLILTNIIGRLMAVEDINYYCSWETWAMIYFYSTNILRNWRIIQPDNKVISFFYWVATARFLRNINYLEEYMKQKQEKENKKKDDNSFTT